MSNYYDAQAVTRLPMSVEISKEYAKIIQKYILESQYEEAKKLFELLLPNQDMFLVDQIYDIALLCFQDASYEVAIHYFDLFLDISPEELGCDDFENDIESHSFLTRGLCKHNLKRYEEAITDFEKAIALDAELDVEHSMSEYYCAKSRSKQSLEKYEEAIVDINQAIAFAEKENNTEEMCDYYNYKASLLIELGQIDEAEEAIDKMVYYDKTEIVSIVNKKVLSMRIELYKRDHT